MIRNRVEWRPKFECLDMVSACGNYVAVYHDSYKGLANYWVFPASVPVSRRRMSAAVSVGGLPRYVS